MYLSRNKTWVFRASSWSFKPTHSSIHGCTFNELPSYCYHFVVKLELIYQIIVVRKLTKTISPDACQHRLLDKKVYNISLDLGAYAYTEHVYRFTVGSIFIPFCMSWKHTSMHSISCSPYRHAYLLVLELCRMSMYVCKTIIIISPMSKSTVTITFSVS